MGTTAYAARVGSGYAYPTAVHERAAQAITEFLASRDETDAVLLANSCARGKATVDSSRLATSSFYSAPLFVRGERLERLRTA